jgi:ADP-ribose pyrophosphatase
MSWDTVKSDMKADFPLFKVFEDVVKLPNGSKLDYYWVDKTPVVVILPVILDKIVMVKQYRYPIKSYSLELPAGHIKPDETPEECAVRELKEETGFTSNKFEKLLEYNPSTEYSTQVYHIFFANDLKESATNREKYELIDIELLEKDTVIKKIRDGFITDGRTITTVFLAHFLNKI